MIANSPRKKNPGWLVALLTFLGAVVVQSYSREPAKETQESSIISDIFVIDGDTVSGKVKGEKVTIRLIGLDAPETRDNERSQQQVGWWNCNLRSILGMGGKARSSLQNLIQGRRIEIVTDVEEHDRFNRKLGYLYSDGKNINAELLRLGVVKRLRVQPNNSKATELDSAELEARKGRRGFWADSSSCSFRAGSKS